MSLFTQHPGRLCMVVAPQGCQQISHLVLSLDESVKIIRQALVKFDCRCRICFVTTNNIQIVQTKICFNPTVSDDVISDEITHLFAHLQISSPTHKCPKCTNQIGPNYRVCIDCL